MKIAKKSLSVLLSFLMVFTTCSVCLTGLSLSASAASSYTAAEVKALVTAAAADAAKVSSSSNTWNLTGDDGTVLEAAQAVYDYAVNGVRVSSSTGNPNSSDTLVSRLLSDLGFSSSSNEGVFIRNVINPNGTAVYGQSNRQSSSGSWEDRSGSPTTGADVTGNGNVSYSGSVSDTVNKSSSVEINLSHYLVTFDSIDDIPSTFITKVTYRFNHTYGRSATCTNRTQRTEKDGCDDITYYRHYWTSYKWNYISGTPQRVTTQDSTTQADLKSYENYFSAARLATTSADLLNQDAASLQALYEEGVNKYNKLLTDYTSAVVTHFFDTAAIENYISEVQFAMQVVMAQPNMALMLGYIEAGYDNTNREQMGTIYTNASAAYNAIKDYPATVFDFVIENYEGFDGFTLEASKAFLDALYYDIELYDIRVLKNSIDADIAKETPRVEDPENKEDITDLELAALKDKFTGYMNSYNSFSPEARDAVFTDGVLYIYDFQTLVQTKIDTRAAQVDYENYYEYFLPKIFAPIEQWTNDYIMTRYDEDTVVQGQLNDSYDKHLAAVGEEIVTSVFTFTYEEQDYLLTTAVDDYIASLKANIIARNSAQLQLIKSYKDMSTNITFVNFIGVKTAIDKFDSELYDYVIAKNWASAEDISIYNMINPLLAEYEAFVASGGLNTFEQNHYHDADGVYVIRYAGDQTDADGNQLGYTSDLARDGEKDNYVVDIDKVNQTIVKLDKFLTSEDFCSLVGFENKETGEAYSTLSEAIDSLLSENLFTNEMVNVIVALIFPMLTETIGDLLGDLAGLGVEGIYPPTKSGSCCRIDLGVFAGDTASGIIDLYIDGNQGTNTLQSVFETLGIYIYPNSFSKKLPSKYSAIAAELNKAGKDWNYFYDSETDGVLLDFDWGVSDYATFVGAVGCIFDAFLPLLRTVLVGQNYSQKVNNLAYVTADSIKASLSGFSVNINAKVRANATIGIVGLTLFKDLWIPLMEQLGITDNLYDISGLASKSSGISIANNAYKFRSISASSSSTDIANAMFEPLLVLIEQLKYQPLEKVLDILPQVMYLLSMDGIQSMIDGINLHINVKLEVSSIDDIGFNNSIASFLLDWLLGLARNLIRNILNDNLPAFDIPLALGDMINLKDMLGFEYTNINTLLSYLMTSLGVDFALPIINAGEIIQCSSFNRNASSQGGSGTRLKFTADRADVFYYLLSYIVSAVGDKSFVEGIIKFIQNSSAEEDPDASGEPVTVELPEVVYEIIGNVNSNPKGALAALVELFIPQRYDTMDYTWAESKYNYGDIEGMTAASVVYLKYGNDWTREKAEYVVNNVDELLEAVLELAGAEETSINVLLQNSVAQMFSNMNVTGLVKGLAQLGVLIGNDFVYELLERELDVDLTLWYDAFGYMFEDVTAESATPALEPGDEGYVNNTGVTAVASGTDEEGNTLYTWYVNGTEFVDGDREVFVDLFCALAGEFAPVISLFLSGEDIGLFNDAIELLGYENYANSIGMFFQMLGIENVMTQQEYSAMDPVEAFNTLTNQLFDWIDYILSGNTIEKICELLPAFVYFLESNGLSTVIHNLLMPVLVLLDDVRPIINLDVNKIVSVIVSDLLNTGSVDFEQVLNIIAGTYEAPTDPAYKMFDIDLHNITISEVVRLVDTYFGTNFISSPLIDPGLKGLCSGRVQIENSVIGEAYTSTVDAADALTIILSGLIDSLDYPAQDASKTNLEVVIEFIEQQTGRDDIAQVADAILEIIGGIEYEYISPNWGYMFEYPTDFSVTLPEHSIVYLDYRTDWTKEAADSVYASLGDIVDMILSSAVEEGATIATLIDGVLNDNVYTNEIVNTVIELLVNLLADFDGTLLELVDTVISTNLSDWFDYCTYNEETGEYECTYDWGIDTAEDKKTAFVTAVTTALEPANDILAWFLFGDSYAFFHGTETDANGDYTYNDLLVLNGGEGYDYGLVPLLEALGVNVKAASAYYDEATNSYDVSAAVEDVFTSLLELVDTISANPGEEVFKLLPNLIYYINADGLKASVNNILSPVNTIIEKLSPVISTDGNEVSLGALIEEQLGVNISDLSMTTLLGFAADKGFVMTSEMVEILRTFYIGELTRFVSANGNEAYKMTYTDEESASDMLTIVLSFALEAFKLNGEIFGDLLGQETYDAIVTILEGASGKFEYTEPDWAYMYSGDDALAQLVANNLPERTGENSIIYTQYTNNWNEATASYLNDSLNEIVSNIVTAVREDGSTLGEIIDAGITDGLYKDEILNKLVCEVVKLLAGLDKTIVDAIGVTLGIDVDVWFSYCAVEYDADGNVVSVTSTKDWGIDSKTTNEEKRAAFIDAFVEALAPANRVLAWLFFAQDYTFFVDSTNEEIITLTGGEGYNYGLVPILEGLGLDAKASGEFYVDGELDMSMAVEHVFTLLTDLLYDICGDLKDAQNGVGALDVMLELLPNIVYFVNAGGLKSSVNNLLMPVDYLLTTLAPVVGDVDLDEMIGFPLTNLDFYAVYDILGEKLGLYFPENVGDFIATFYMGKVEQFTSVNGNEAFYMTYDETETRREMITILISLVIDVFEYDQNEERFKSWLGEDVYEALKAVLGLKEAKPMQDFSWYYTEYANTDKTFTAIETSGKYTGTYNEYWTKDKAQYIADNLEVFIGNILCLLGLEIDGISLDNIETIVRELLVSKVYTQANIDAILNMLKELIGQITSLEPYGEYVVEVLDKALGVDLTAWDNMSVTIVEGDAESFKAGLVQILTPAVPLLKLILAGEDVSFFIDIDGGEDQIVIPGSEGYAYGIIPALEALGCTGVLTPAEYKAAGEANESAYISAILDPLFARVDVIAADPLNEVLDMLPALVYFINSNGLDTCFKNIVNSVDTVLAALEPLIGAADLQSLMGIDMSTIDFEYLFDYALEAVKDSTGYDLTGFAADAVSELTVGKVVSYESKNGETYYTMVYGKDRDRADMVTIVLRIVIDFITSKDNIEKIKELLKQYIPNEDNYKSVCSLIDSLASYASQDPGMGQSLYLLYYIFIGANESAEVIDDLYHDVNNSWQFILKLLSDSSDPLLNSFATNLKGTLNKYFDGIFTEEGVAPNGFITFFQKLGEFFRKIIEFFKNLFNRG